MNIKEKQQELVEQIAADIAAGKPFFWESGVLQSDRPKNLTREGDAAFYRGGNRVRLTYTAICKGYTDNRWATFKQAQAIGAKIKKGEKGTPIVYYQFESEVWKKNPQTGKSEPVYEIDPKTGKKFIKKVKLDPPLVKGSIVFNAEQMENVPPLPARERVVDAANEKMEQMLANSEAPIHYDQSEKNFYTPSKDEIHLVPREGFKTNDYFYATAAHEIAHSTGHESRLARKFGSAGTDAYAKEELRAELTSLFLHQEYGIAFDEKHYKNHAAYLQSWSKALKDDTNELFRAAKDAEKAAEYIKAKMIEKSMEKKHTQVQERTDGKQAAGRDEIPSIAAKTFHEAVEQAITQIKQKASEKAPLSVSEQIKARQAAKYKKDQGLSLTR